MAHSCLGSKRARAEAEVQLSDGQVCNTPLRNVESTLGLILPQLHKGTGRYNCRWEHLNGAEQKGWQISRASIRQYGMLLFHFFPFGQNYVLLMFTFQGFLQPQEASKCLVSQGQMQCSSEWDNHNHVQGWLGRGNNRSNTTEENKLTLSTLR